MESLQARLDSFLKPIRVKHSSGKSVSLKWPHPSHFTATPSALAEAGFYFCPTWDERDAVRCYMCGKELSDWLGADDPFDIHWTKCRTSCPWAIVRCGLRDDVDRDGNYVFSDSARIPSSKSMEKARLQTFVGWPHDSSKSHGATSKKMSRAGFVHTPQSAGDDTATCLYCNISLNGWEDDDDPLQEHQKREQKGKSRCAFFPLQNSPVPSTSGAVVEDDSAEATLTAPRRPKRRTNSKLGGSLKRPQRKAKEVEKREEQDSVPKQIVMKEPVSAAGPAKKTEARPTRQMNPANIPVTGAKPTRDSLSTKSHPQLAAIDPAFPTPSKQTPGTEHNSENVEGPLSQSAKERVDIWTTADEFDRQVLSNGPYSFIPPLATTSINGIVSVSEGEMNMTVEEWIRNEMALQLEQFKTDGERVIGRFQETTKEVSHIIQSV